MFIISCGRFILGAHLYNIAAALSSASCLGPPRLSSRKSSLGRTRGSLGIFLVRDRNQSFDSTGRELFRSHLHSKRFNLTKPPSTVVMGRMAKSRTGRIHRGQNSTHRYSIERVLHVRPQLRPSPRA